jgi:hypothetical protein
MTLEERLALAREIAVEFAEEAGKTWAGFYGDLRNQRCNVDNHLLKVEERRTDRAHKALPAP